MASLNTENLLHDLLNLYSDTIIGIGVINLTYATNNKCAEANMPRSVLLRRHIAISFWFLI